MPTSSSSSSDSTTPGGGAPNHTVRVNQAILLALSKAEQISLVAQKTGYVPLLQARGILPAEVVAELTSIAAAHVLAGVSGKVAKLESTAAEGRFRDQLLEKVVEMQTAAKIRFRVSDPLHLQIYHVGKNLGASRADLEQFAPDIIDHAETDALAGITAGKITAARNALLAYVGSNTDQSTVTSASGTQQINLKNRLQEIVDGRIRIQLAADAQWPHTNPNNAAIRREFQLPVKTRFNV